MISKFDAFRLQWKHVLKTPLIWQAFTKRHETCASVSIGLLWLLSLGVGHSTLHGVVTAIKYAMQCISVSRYYFYGCLWCLSITRAKTIWQANHCAACVYRRKSLKYERSADRQSAETRTHQYTAYPTFILLSAINSSLCIIPVMCCRNVIHFFYSNTSVFTLIYMKMFNASEISD